MYAQLKTILKKHKIVQNEMSAMISMVPSQFSRKLNRVSGMDFTISQGKSIQEQLKKRGSDFTLEEIFETENNK